MMLRRRPAPPEAPPFHFLDPGPLEHGELRLRALEPTPASGERAPTYHFEMQCGGEAAGSIELRIGATYDILTYTGQIGYRVEPAFRGRRLAARSCRLLLPLARRHGMAEVWITCDHDNAASFRTCELAGGELVETVPVPRTHPYWSTGSRKKCRFRITLR